MEGREDEASRPFLDEASRPFLDEASRPFLDEASRPFPSIQSSVSRLAILPPEYSTSTRTARPEVWLSQM